MSSPAYQSFRLHLETGDFALAQQALDEGVCLTSTGEPAAAHDADRSRQEIHLLSMQHGWWWSAARGVAKSSQPTRGWDWLAERGLPLASLMDFGCHSPVDHVGTVLEYHDVRLADWLLIHAAIQPEALRQPALTWKALNRAKGDPAGLAWLAHHHAIVETPPTKRHESLIFSAFQLHGLGSNRLVSVLVSQGIKPWGANLMSESQETTTLIHLAQRYRELQWGIEKKEWEQFCHLWTDLVTAGVDPHGRTVDGSAMDVIEGTPAQAWAEAQERANRSLKIFGDGKAQRSRVRP